MRIYSFVVLSSAATARITATTAVEQADSISFQDNRLDDVKHHVGSLRDPALTKGGASDHEARMDVPILSKICEGEAFYKRILVDHREGPFGSIDDAVRLIIKHPDPKTWDELAAYCVTKFGGGDPMKALCIFLKRLYRMNGVDEAIGQANYRQVSQGLKKVQRAWYEHRLVEVPVDPLPVVPAVDS
uniref:Uncharacterized protein n=1 Tax=Peronospora matthiolae TaxID=2874970 RepID=A0AAV1VF22_9STRA